MFETLGHVREGAYWCQPVEGRWRQLRGCDPGECKGGGPAGVNLERGTSNNIEQPCSGLICSARPAGSVIW